MSLHRVQEKGLRTLDGMKGAVLKAYPVREGSSGLNPTTILNKQGKVLFMVDFMSEEQYKDLFAEDFAKDTPYIMQKLK